LEHCDGGLSTSMQGGMARCRILRAMTAAPTAHTTVLTADVISDVVCPWCYIGKRRLEAALATLPARASDPRTEVRWHPFQLNPDVPKSGVDRRAYLDAKFGGARRAREIYARVQAAAQTVGLALDFDRIARQPNTLDAHRLIAWAQRVDGEGVNTIVEDLFRAYFVEGRDIGNHRELAAIAGAAGYDVDAARALLGSDRLESEVASAERRARALGIGGVPLFIFDGKVAVSGAQEPATLLEAIASARSGS
jgi:predicted DsbA family dithiol-disulfide isomerase